MDFCLFNTPLGQMALASENGAITRLYLPGTPIPRIISRKTPLLCQGETQLLEYFTRERKKFDLPLAPQGTPFQRKVWTAICDIPYGQTRSYRDLALAVDCPRGARAAGCANHNNPIPILIPCHRVIGTNGSLTGYAGGLAAKGWLLKMEGIPTR